MPMAAAAAPAEMPEQARLPVVAVAILPRVSVAVVAALQVVVLPAVLVGKLSIVSTKVATEVFLAVAGVIGALMASLEHLAGLMDKEPNLHYMGLIV